MARFIVLYDACVLYPAPLRDLLIELARTGLFQAKWTERIHAEWTRNLRARRPELDPAKLQGVVELMNQAVADCLVSQYEELIDGLCLPDPDDRHVLAAAIRCGAQTIVTFNLNGFPAVVLDRYGIEAQHPDDFLLHQLSPNPSLVCGAIRTQRARLQNPPKSAEDILATFAKQGLGNSVAQLEAWAHLL